MRIAAACSVPLKRHISAWNGGLCRKHLMRASTALVRSLEFSAGLGVSPNQIGSMRSMNICRISSMSLTRKRNRNSKRN